MRRLWMVALLCFYAPAVWAGQVVDERPTTPDYSKLYYLGYNNATSSSPCIGNPITPECAVETALSCVFWNDKKLCDSVGLFYRKIKKIPPNKNAMIYKFLYKKTVEKKDIPWLYIDKWQVGDTIIPVALQICYPDNGCLIKSDVLPSKCSPIFCEMYGNSIYGYDEKDNNKVHLPHFYVLRQKKDGLWVRASYMGPDTASMPRAIFSNKALNDKALDLAPW